MSKSNLVRVVRAFAGVRTYSLDEIIEVDDPVKLAKWKSYGFVVELENNNTDHDYKLVDGKLVSTEPVVEDNIVMTATDNPDIVRKKRKVK